MTQTTETPKEATTMTTTTIATPKTATAKMPRKWKTKTFLDGDLEITVDYNPCGRYNQQEVLVSYHRTDARYGLFIYIPAETGKTVHDRWLELDSVEKLRDFWQARWVEHSKFSRMSDADKIAFLKALENPQKWLSDTFTDVDRAKCGLYIDSLPAETRNKLHTSKTGLPELL
ncbi:MAG: hypothetical protein HQL06_15990, partial [Nitrospirae bacterium]|nr:hypothetical protein [Nitrospirota bacterium]